jgi:LemA protein
MIPTIILIALVVVLVAFVSYFITVYNSLIIVKNNILKAWSNIDVLLKQRHDEIPKLVKVCEGYSQFEKKTLTDVIALRNSAAGAQSVGDKAAKEGALTMALGRLFAVAEAYPDLKSNNNFLQLQKRVSDLENQIADRREFYNESVNNYNIRIESLPDRFIAGPMGLQKQEMFKVADSDREDVDINFNLPK